MINSDYQKVFKKELPVFFQLGVHFKIHEMSNMNKRSIRIKILI